LLLEVATTHLSTPTKGGGEVLYRHLNHSLVN